MRKEYWMDCVKCACEDAGVLATKEQIEIMAGVFQGAYENHSLAFGDECIPNQKDIEIKRLSNELKVEREKVVCQECFGRGRITSNFGFRLSVSQCSNCNGEGYKLP